MAGTETETKGGKKTEWEENRDEPEGMGRNRKGREGMGWNGKNGYGRTEP